jgi:hypothetical protein
MGNGIALLIESLVAVLLIMTIGYCYLLNQRLAKLRSDEGVLKATIAELVTATDIAGRAISGLKQAVNDCDSALGERLTRAERLSAELGAHTATGEEIVKRIAMIAAAAKPGPLRPEQEPANSQTSRATATLAAAQAFVRRTQERQSGVAA